MAPAARRLACTANSVIMSTMPPPEPADDQTLRARVPFVRGSRMRLRGHLVILGKVIVTCVSLWWVSRMVDVRELRTILTTVSVPWLGLSFISFTMFAVLGGLRWWIVLRAIGQPARLGMLVSLFWTGMVLNQILPSAAGESIRAWLAVRSGYRLRSVVNSIVLDRVFMLAALLVIVLATQPLLASFVSVTPPIWFPALLAACCLSGIVVLTFADRFSPRLVLWKTLGWISLLSSDTRRVVGSGWMMPMVALCVFANLNFIVAGGLLGTSLGLRLDGATYLAVIPLVVVVTIIPISIAGWGLREGLLVSLLSQAGVQPNVALAFSLMFGLSNAVCSLPGLVLWWLRSERPVAVTS
jgi:glycosyltransferase 2 family protein